METAAEESLPPISSDIKRVYGKHTATNGPGRNTRVTVAMTRISVLPRRVRIATFLESSAMRRDSSAIRMEASAAL
jgi:hypothetical protein